MIFLSALKYHVYPDQWVGFYRPLWLMSSVINSLYSFYWDIKRDWDLRFVASLHNDFTICSAFHTSLLLLLMSFALHTRSILTRIFMFKNPSIWTNLLYGQNWVWTWTHKCFLVNSLDNFVTCLSCTNSTGILLGIGQQFGSAMHMDIQALGASSAQLPDSVHHSSSGNTETVAVGVLPSREWVEQDDSQTKLGDVIWHAFRRRQATGF